VTFFIAKPNVPDLETLRELVEAGKLRPIIDRTYALSDIAQAVEYAATERVAGKIAIRVAGSPVSAG
jgi:NADPH:quinone reductase-like Zn-dependent oxidoreductase